MMQTHAVRSRPAPRRRALARGFGSILACGLGACALAKAGAIGLDLLRKTFDGVTEKNYGEQYREDADKLFALLSKPVGERLAVEDARASPSLPEPPPASAPEAATVPEAAVAPASVEVEAAPALALEVGLLKEEVLDGRSTPVPVQDGEILHDEFGSHGAGDNLKFMFKTNAPAHVYVISIDGTGWIQPVFPGVYAGFSNPVEAHRAYLFPEGSTWATLDSYRGVEHLYFIASRSPRADIEKALTVFASRVRDADPTRSGEARPLESVASAAPVTRGFGAPRKSVVAGVPASTGETFDVDAQMFTSTGPGDIVVTRWFRHQ